MKRVSIFAACTLALAASQAWAYGAYKHTDSTGILLETLPPFIKIILMSLIPYLVCSIWMDRTTPGMRFLPLAFNLALSVGLVMPEMFVLGEFGPAHVALHAASPSCIIFPGLLIAKFLVLLLRGSAPEAPEAPLAPAK